MKIDRTVQKMGGGAMDHDRLRGEGVLDPPHDLRAEVISSSIRDATPELALLERRIKNRDETTRLRVKQTNDMVTKLMNLFPSQRLLGASEKAPSLNEQGLWDELLGIEMRRGWGGAR